MELYCTRPGCSRPRNVYPDLDDRNTLVTTQQKYCTACGMPLILVGRYLPQRLLGQGGFGAAFLARDRYTPGLRTCVVKLFQPSGDLNAAQLKIAQGLFEREAEVLEALGNKHPQIPDLFAFFPLTVPSASGSGQEEYFYLVQEFIDGENLEDELARRGAFPQDDVRTILEEILKVLKFVHENGSIHRDIKPSNIMRSQDGTIYLLDFGAVKQATKGGSANPKQSSTGIYSQGYAPPEQMAGSQVYPSTDLYALAVTCISLLTGKDPLELYDGYHNTWQWRSHVSQLDLSLAAVLDRLLQPVPSDRFASAAEVLAVLKRQQSSVLPKPPTAARSSSPPPAPPSVPAPPITATSPRPAAPLPPPAPPAPITPAAPAPAPVPARAAPQPIAQRSPTASGASPTVPRLWSFDFLGQATLMGVVCGGVAVLISSLAPPSLALTPIGLGFWLVLLAEMTLIQFPCFFNFAFLGVLVLVALALLFLVAPTPAILAVIPPLVAAGQPWVNFLLLLGIVALMGTVIAVFYRLFFSWLARLFP